ncbi:hypothetical protein [Ornithinimicrobium kibberense]|uniref:hypothetical protein n=1 Tax=Ornithinimicrobium kibberense TaxID=282060 RepID=UPI0036163A99
MGTFPGTSPGTWWGRASPGGGGQGAEGAGGVAGDVAGVARARRDPAPAPHRAGPPGEARGVPT